MKVKENNSTVSAFVVYQTLKSKPKQSIKKTHVPPAKKLKKAKLENKKLLKTLNNDKSAEAKKILNKKPTTKASPISENGNKSPKKEVKKVILKSKKESKAQPRKQVNVDFANDTVSDSDSSSSIEYEQDMQVNEDPRIESQKVFEWLIAPVQLKKFFERKWEKDVLHVKRSQSKYYSTIFNTERLDTILRENSLQYTQNVDVVSYENGVKEVHNPEGRAVPAALWDFYSNGCSIRILNPQTYDHSVHLLISTLQEYFGTMVGTNVYLTPPGSQGFAPHFDDIEAFIVQLEGRKHWRLYKPKDKDVLARDSSHNFNHDDLDEPFLEVTLEAGDLLYFPRGTIHEGRTDDDAHSLHITVSVYQHTAYADLLEKILPNALQNAAKNDIEFRRGLPMNYLKSLGWVNKKVKSDTRREVLLKVKKLMQTLINHIDVDLAADELGRKFMHDAMPPVLSKSEVMLTSKYDGDYMKNGKVYNRAEIGLDTKIRLLRYHCLRVVDDPSGAKLYYCTDNARVYHGSEEQWLDIDKELMPSIKMLQNHFPNYVEVEQLPIEDVMSKVQLVSDLWERGLVVTEEPLQPVFDSSGDEDEEELSEVSDSVVFE